MKTAIKQVLASAGLVSAGEVRQQAEELRRMSEKVQSLEGRAAKLRADAETWKQRHDEATAKLRELRETANRASADAEELRAGAERAKARATGWKARADALTGEKATLRARLDEAQRAATAAREYVMATETKLDLLEAAIRVLDSRTREATVSGS